MSIEETSSRQVADEDLDEMCGCQVNYGCCKIKERIPIRCLQRFAKPKCALAVFSVAGFFQGFIVSGLINVILTTIQKRFGLDSTETGFILSSYSVASSIVIPFITYVGGKGHKPLWIGWGVVLLAIGCITFSLPHFISGPYVFVSLKDESNLVCKGKVEEDLKIKSNNMYKYIFMAAHALNGCGTASLYTLGMTYLDENVRKKDSSVYHSIYFSIAAALGPAVGYLVGGLMLKVYTDIQSTPTITNTDEAWVGAWWVGFLFHGLLFLILCVPILMFPQYLPNTNDAYQSRSTELHQDTIIRLVTKDKQFGKKIKDLPKSIMMLFRNPAFVSVSLASALDFGLISGMSAFSPKYVESVFSITATQAAHYLGVVVVVGGSTAFVSGGLIVSKAELSVKRIMLLCIMSTIAALICTIGYYVTCPDTKFAGATVPYLNTTVTLPTMFQSQCNENCNCTTDIYSPVCGSDGITYFSPCFAGCQNFQNGTFTNCTCIIANVSKSANLGNCVDSSCRSFTGFLVALFGILFFTILTLTPALQIIVRVVPSKQRSFAVGMMWVIYRCLGGIPTPIVFGKVFDLACAVWSSRNGQPANCRLYFNKDLRNVFLHLLIGYKVSTIGLYSLGLFLYKPPLTSRVQERGPQPLSRPAQRAKRYSVISELGIQITETIPTDV